MPSGFLATLCFVAGYYIATGAPSVGKVSVVSPTPSGPGAVQPRGPDMRHPLQLRRPVRLRCRRLRPSDPPFALPAPPAQPEGVENPGEQHAGQRDVDPAGSETSSSGFFRPHRSSIDLVEMVRLGQLMIIVEATL